MHHNNSFKVNEEPKMLIVKTISHVYFHSGRYIDYLSLPYATNKNKILKLHYKHYKYYKQHSVKRESPNSKK